VPLGTRQTFWKQRVVQLSTDMSQRVKS